MAFLVRCPFSFCQAKKRIDPVPPNGLGVSKMYTCHLCGLRFYALPPSQPGELGYASEDW